jgi:hypothetical protein
LENKKGVYRFLDKGVYFYNFELGTLLVGSVLTLLVFILSPVLVLFVPILAVFYVKLVKPVKYRKTLQSRARFLFDNGTWRVYPDRVRNIEKPRF